MSVMSPIEVNMKLLEMFGLEEQACHISQVVIRLSPSNFPKVRVTSNILTSTREIETTRFEIVKVK